MAETTHISWADATLNFWIGCTKVSPACDHCYAETWGNRFGVKWGPGEARRQTVKWISKARALQRLALAKKAAGGGAFFCFSNSLADIFDNEVPIGWLAGAFEAMRVAPDVTFLLLTKRPGNIVKRFLATVSMDHEHDDPADYWPRNAAILCTVVNQPEADSELPKLLVAKSILRPAFTGVSMEPLLGAVDLTNISTMRFRGAEVLNALTGELYGMFGEPAGRAPALDWVITGGESGVQARPSDPEWFRFLRRQCNCAEVPFHFKQWGEWVQPGDMQTTGPGRVPNTYRLQYFGERAERQVIRVGKEADGRVLDGVLHDARPNI